MSVEEELMNDIMSLMASFSGNYMVCVLKEIVKNKTKGDNNGQKKRYTLEELQEIVSSKELDRLFIEHYLTKVGVDKEHFELDDELTIDDIMK